MFTSDMILDATLIPAMLVALVAGLLSFLSPCVLPIVPPYLAYMGGVSVTDLHEARADLLGPDPEAAAGSAAEPDTSSRADAKPRATSGFSSASAASRWYIVGTANSIVASPSSAAAAASAEKRPR